MPSTHLIRSKRGNITPIFCMFAFVLVGGISYSLYIGQLVTDRMAEQTAADVTAISAANHVAQGLNMISANNLSIGAAIQVAGSVSNLAMYLGTVRALLVTEFELPSAPGIPGPSPAQKKIYDPMAKISKPFLQTASGLTGLNNGIYNYWQYMTPVRAMEVARVNVPGALALAVQRIAFEDDGATAGRTYQFDGMRTTEPKETVCRSYRAAESGSGLAQITTWLSAPFASMTNGLAGGFGSVISAIHRVDSLINAFQPIQISIARGGSSCGLELKLAVRLGIPVPRFLQRIGWPAQFGDIREAVDIPLAMHGSQADHFASEHAQSGDKFGFLVPIKPDTQSSDATVFDRSIEYAQVITSPLRSIRQVGPASCPSSWKRGVICDGVGLTSLVGEQLDEDQMTAPDSMSDEVRKTELNLATGGLQANVRTGGDLASMTGRMKYRISQAKAVFQPRGNAGQAATNTGRERQHQSTLWPGWESSLTHATLLPGVMNKITGMTGLSDFGAR